MSTAVSGATTTATGLNANTSYVFSAYSNSSCTNLLGTASAFTTADVSVSNLSETADGNVTIGTHSSNSYIEKWATAFTTGSSNSPGYTVTTVAAKFNTKNGTPGAIAAKIHADSSGAPGTEVANLTLTGRTTSPSGEDAEYTCAGTGCSLAASTTYHLVFEVSGTTTGVNYQWRSTTSKNETNTPSNAGWSITNAGASQWRGDTSSWTANANTAISTMFSVSANQNSSGQSVGNAAPIVAGWRLERDAAGVLRVTAAAGGASGNPSTPDTPSGAPAPGAPDPASDLTALAAAGNTSPDGLWSDGMTMWVVDTDDRMLYAYPVPAADVTLHPANASPSALWTDGATLWVAEDTDGRLYAYDLVSGSRAPAQDLTLHPDNASSGGPWSDGVTMWVSDPEDGVVYAYRLSDGARDARLDYTVSDDSARVYGLWSDGWTLWLADDGSDRVVGYRAH